MIAIQVLYCESCPSHEQALVDLHQVIGEEGLDAAVSTHRVESEADARRLHFVGSPTILVNGKDIDPPPADAPPALTCRAYRLEDGRISPLPSIETIRTALRTAAAPPEHKPFTP